MNVLFVTRNLWPSFGAAATVNTEVAKGLSRRGHTVNMLAPNSVFEALAHRSGPSPLFPSGCKVYKFGPSLSRLPGYTISFIILILRAIPLALRAHVLLCEYHRSHLSVLCAAATSVIGRKPLVVKVHDVLVPEPKSMVQSIVNLILKLTTLWSFRRAKMILVPGDELVDVCRRTYGLQSGVLDVSYNGADVKRFTHHNRSNELRRSIGSRHIVIFSGLLSQGRGLEVLFNAASLIRERVPDLKVLITGDGPDLPHLRNLASTSGLNDCIVFTGAVHPDTFPTYLASADVGIGELQEDCTNYGSTPLKIVEYMASGCVVVTAKGAVSKGLIRDGINGLLSSSSDPNDVAKKILMVFHDKRKAKNIRKQARQTVEEKFSWDVIVSELERKIRDLVTNTGKNQQYD